MKQRKGENKDLTLPPHPKTPPEHIKEQYRALFQGIRDKNPGIYLLVSAIIPRPFDYKQNKKYMCEVNLALEDLCKEFNSCYFLKTYKPMLRFGIPKSTHYLDDGLHLSQQGSITLQKFFMSHLVNKIKKC